MLLTQTITHTTSPEGWHLFYPESDNPYPRLEVDHQEDTATWINYWYPEFKAFHVVNESGGKSDKKYGALLQRLGRRSGVTDWIIPCRFGDWPIAFVELKRDSRKKGRLSKEQRENLAHYQAQGYFVAVCWGWESFVSCVNYLVNLNCNSVN